MKNTILCVTLAASALLFGCASRHIYQVVGCDDRLGSPYKRMECRSCVERQFPHVYLPDNPDGQRCARR